MKASDSTTSSSRIVSRVTATLGRVLVHVVCELRVGFDKKSNSYELEQDVPVST